MLLRSKHVIKKLLIAGVMFSVVQPCGAYIRIAHIIDFSIKQTLLTNAYSRPLLNKIEFVSKYIELIQMLPQKNGTYTPVGVMLHNAEIPVLSTNTQFELPEFKFDDQFSIRINEYLVVGSLKIDRTNTITLTKNNKCQPNGKYSVIIYIDTFGDTRMIDCASENYGNIIAKAPQERSNIEEPMPLMGAFFELAERLENDEEKQAKEPLLMRKPKS